jgi:hypothetical protein
VGFLSQAVGLYSQAVGQIWEMPGFFKKLDFSNSMLDFLLSRGCQVQVVQQKMQLIQGLSVNEKFTFHSRKFT